MITQALVLNFQKILNKNIKDNLIHLAILGYSTITKRYLKILDKIENAQCNYILTSQKNINYKKYYKKNDIFFTLDIKRIISDRNIKKILILNEPSKHLDYVIELLKNNIDLLIEKPIYNRIDTELFSNITNTINQTNSNIYIVSQYRYDEALLSMKKKLSIYHEANCLLKISIPRSKEYYTHGNKWRMEESGVFFNQAYHWIDILYWFFGEIEKVELIQQNKAKKDNYNCTTEAKLVFKNNSKAKIFGTTFSKNKYIIFKIYNKNNIVDYKIEKLIRRFKDFIKFKFKNMNSSEILQRKQIINFLENNSSNLVDFKSSLDVLKTVLHLSK